MASSSVMSSRLGACRGYFVGKNSVIRQLTSEGHHRVARGHDSLCCSLKQSNFLHRRGQALRQGKNFLLPAPLLSLPPPATTPFGAHGERTNLDLGLFPIQRAAFSSSSGIVGLLEEQLGIEDGESFVEIGYIADTHGLQGELHVHSLTDFPEERFEKPGFRWLRRLSKGRPIFHQVELLKGRAGPGKRPSWLIFLKDVTTPEKASELVGSTMMVAEDMEKRPSLDDDEFYVPDLVGMKVALQESGEEIGVVLDVFKTGGAQDLLRVRLESLTDEGEGRKIWVPFVKEIVPVFDKELNRVEIVPPEGLLELNAPAKSKEERESEKQGFKVRRKLRGKLGGLKKKLIAMGQTHIFAGLSSGTKEERDSLLEQLLSIDFRILQQALEEILTSESVERPPVSAGRPEPPPAFPKVNWSQIEELMDSPSSSPRAESSAGDNVDMRRWWRDGLELVAAGKVAVVVLAGGQSTRLGQSAPPVKGMVDLGGKSLFQLQAERLLLVQELASLVVHPEFNPFIPWIIMTSDVTEKPTKEYFEEKGFFGLDESQVLFIKQDSMPCVQVSPEREYQILMETPWKIAEAPNGNGGLFSALHNDGTIDRLVEEGIEYVQVYAVDNALVRVADPVFFGYTKERGADVGVKVVTKLSPDEAVGVVCLQTEISLKEGELGESSNRMESEISTSESHYEVLEYNEIPEELRHAYEESGESEGTSRERRLQFRAAHICVNIFSVDFLKRLTESEFEVKFHTALKRIPHVRQEDKEWVQVVPQSLNGTKLELYIFDVFRYCDKSKLALLEVHREEEFAPVKNAAGEGVPDTVDTTRELVLRLQRRLSSPIRVESQNPGLQLLRNRLVAYLGGSVERDVLGLLEYGQDEELSQ